jgi:hypothetical protein
MGSMHANVVGGPYACVLDSMPPLPPTGRKRIAAGLGNVPLRHDEMVDVKRERAARSLIALLSPANAAFVLDEPLSSVEAQPPGTVAKALVGALKQYGESSLCGAASALGRLLTWVQAHKPPGTIVGGLVAGEFLDALPRESRDSVQMHFRWLHDWCGSQLPVRGAVCRAARVGHSVSSNDKESFGLFIIIGLEDIAALHPSRFVRGHAAAWLFLALHALRVEQSRGCFINAWALRGVFQITLAAVLHDKHPDPSKRRPRPVWGCFDGFVHPGKARSALVDSLTGAESVGCILRDTDSRSGDPSTATAWIASGVESTSRIDASIQSLLQMHPICLSHEQASRYHGHSAKRFLLNVAEAAPSLSLSADGVEFGRFGGSTAQNTDLEPTQAMLRQHELRSAQLPSIYAGKAKVETVFSRLTSLQTVVTTAVDRVRRGREIPHEHGFSQAFDGL